ncbi:MAG TPA: Ig-like domain-containing protein [Nitrospirota bacterium]|nr:Ig-like domain-containing protein [Nitrospirota bacterium]
MMHIVRRPLEIIVLASLLAACGNHGTTTSTPSTLTAIAVKPANSAIAVTADENAIAPGTSAAFRAVGTYSNNVQRDITTSVTWTSSDVTIATISNAPGSQGLATSLMTFGSTTIMATQGSIFGITTLITSTVDSIAVSPASASIAPKTAQQFIALGTLESGNSQDLTTSATWISSDSSVATIGLNSGLATAGTTSGSSMISATYSSVTGTAALISSPVTSIAVSPVSASIANGTTQQFTALGTLTDAAIQSLTTWASWTSSDTGVATISSTDGTKGLVTSVSTGTTFITATFDSVSSPSSTLSVTPAVLSSITITPPSSNIPLGKTQQFAASGTFSGGLKQDISSSVTWNSSKTGVATINNTGLATSLAIGTTDISATLSGKTSNMATFTVTSAALESILVTPVAPTIVISSLNPTQQFTATGVYTDNSLKDLTKSVNWNSSDTSVAKISNTAGSQGLATPVTNGTTTITATFDGVPANPALLTVQF